MQLVQVELVLGKETKNKYVYEAGDDQTAAVISSLYITKSAFTGKPPAAISVVIEDGEEDQ